MTFVIINKFVNVCSIYRYWLSASFQLQRHWSKTVYILYRFRIVVVVVVVVVVIIIIIANQNRYYNLGLLVFYCCCAIPLSWSIKIYIACIEGLELKLISPIEQLMYILNETKTTWGRKFSAKLGLMLLPRKGPISFSAFNTDQDP